MGVVPGALVPWLRSGWGLPEPAAGPQISQPRLGLAARCDSDCSGWGSSSFGPHFGLKRLSLSPILGDENGFNIPTVTLCPEVAKYLDLPLAVLALEQPRDMDGVAKRLFCDAYMYMYQSKKMALYK